MNTSRILPPTLRGRAAAPGGSGSAQDSQSSPTQRSKTHLSPLPSRPSTLAERFKLKQKASPVQLGELNNEDQTRINDLVAMVGGTTSETGKVLGDRLPEVKAWVAPEMTEQLNDDRQGRKQAPLHTRLFASNRVHRENYDKQVELISKYTEESFPVMLDVSVTSLAAAQSKVGKTEPFVAHPGGRSEQLREEGIGRAAQYICGISKTIRRGNIGGRGEASKARSRFIKENPRFMEAYAAAVIEEAHEKFPGNAILSDEALHHINQRFEPQDSDHAKEAFGAMLSRMPPGHAHLAAKFQTDFPSVADQYRPSEPQSKASLHADGKNLYIRTLGGAPFPATVIARPALRQELDTLANSTPPGQAINPQRVANSIVDYHRFEDGNGRTARVVKAVMEMRLGRAPTDDKGNPLV